MGEVNFSDRTPKRVDPHTWIQLEGEVVCKGHVFYRVPIWHCGRCELWSTLPPRFIRSEDLAACVKEQHDSECKASAGLPAKASGGLSGVSSGLDGTETGLGAAFSGDAACNSPGAAEGDLGELMECKRPAINFDENEIQHNDPLAKYRWSSLGADNIWDFIRDTLIQKEQ